MKMKFFSLRAKTLIFKYFEVQILYSLYFFSKLFVYETET